MEVIASFLLYKSVLLKRKVVITPYITYNQGRNSAGDDL